MYSPLAADPAIESSEKKYSLTLPVQHGFVGRGEEQPQAPDPHFCVLKNHLST